MLFAAVDGMGSIDPFFSWLAAQPAFVAVGLGIVFCLLIAPALLALVAAGLTRLEVKVGRILEESGILAVNADPALNWESLRRAIAEELPGLRRPPSKSQS
jgi:hypothetical protein